MDKNEIIEMLIRYGRDNHGIIDLSNADFGGMTLKCNGIKALTIHNYYQKAESIDNMSQEATTINNGYQFANLIINNYHKAGTIRNKMQHGICEIDNRGHRAKLITNEFMRGLTILNEGQIGFNRLTNIGQQTCVLDNNGQIICDKIHQNVGEFKRTIGVKYEEDFQFRVGCFTGTAEELEKASMDKYGEDNPYLDIIEDYRKNLKKGE